VHADAMTLQILKTDDTAQKTPLKDAEFELYRAIYNKQTALWEKTGARIGTVVTGENGMAAFATKLSPGNYCLAEIKAPPNCIPLNTDTIITLNGDGTGKIVQGTGVLTGTGLAFWQVQITNTRRLTLPATGGIGTECFFVAGGGFFMFAAALCVVWLQSRRKEGDDTS
ncbi:MAG: prealbumin-like fold domain-containing protein, partial [Ruthenibacterium sp.]